MLILTGTICLILGTLWLFALTLPLMTDLFMGCFEPFYLHPAKRTIRYLAFIVFAGLDFVLFGFILYWLGRVLWTQLVLT